MKDIAKFLVTITLILYLISPLSSIKAYASPQTKGDSLENVVNEVLQKYISDKTIPGAAVSIVKDGKIELLKGYGYSDIKLKTEVNPETTMFRLGSVSKLFTWTSVMQLKQNKLVYLDRDINNYLPNEIKVPDYKGQPITLSNLMSHTSGFEDFSVNGLAFEEKDFVSLDKWLIKNMPKRVFNPGEIISYSNYGTSLAGFIAGYLNNQTFIEYVNENIFEPLNMINSTFEQPLPPLLTDNMANGYYLEDNEFIDGDFELIMGGPDGGGTSTAKDMAKFIIAHLSDKSSILDQATTKEMHKTLFTHNPKMNGNSHGFWENNYGSIKTIEHMGELDYFSSLLSISPENDIGIFISMNILDKNGIRNKLANAVYDYYTGKTNENIYKQQKQENDKSIAGNYMVARQNYSTLYKIQQLIIPGSVVKVKNLENGNILVGEATYYPIGEDVYETDEIDKSELQSIGFNAKKICITRDFEGKSYILSIGGDDLIKIPWYKTNTISIVALAVSVITFIVSLIILIVKRKCFESLGTTLITSISTLGIVLLVVLFGTIALNYQYIAFIGIPPILKYTLMILSPCIAVLSFVLLLYTMYIFIKDKYGLAIKFVYAYISLVSLIYFIFLKYWNIIK